MLQALQGRHAGQKFPVVQAIAKLSDAHGNDYCAEVNEALYDNNNEQKESLLSVHQARSDGKTAVDDCSKTEMDIRGNHGTQCSRFKDTMVHFFFDGKKCFYKISRITDKEKTTPPQIIITPREKFQPEIRTHTRTLKEMRCTIDWHKTLAFAPKAAITKTLEATTQMVPTLQAETRQLMRDHLKTRMPFLKVRRVDDTMCQDTFISSIISIRGYKCFNLHCYKKSGYAHVSMMKRKSESTTALKTCFQDCGVPHTLLSNNAKEFKSKEVILSY